MREEGVNLLSQSLCLSDRLSSERMLAYTKFISTGLKFLSFLEVSYLGGIISEMNYSVLKYEFETLIKKAEFEEKGSGNKSLIFPEHFFEVQADQVDESSSVLSKGQTLMSDRMSLKKTTETVRTNELKQKDKSNRQEVIINLLKKGGELSIKDFTSSIKDCSEKTIQRELVLLVSKGLIKKAGEKRWSKYSLK
jgi:Fic family protein